MAPAAPLPPATRGSEAPDEDAEVPSARTRILRGAAEAFGRLGYGATSVESILEASGVSRRTFYKAFRSKEDVFAVLFENSVGMLLGAVKGARDAGGSRQTRIVAAIDAYVRVHARAGALARVLLLERFPPDSPLARQRDAAIATFSKNIADAIVADGRPAPDPILVRAVVAAINEIAVQMATESPDGKWDVERAKRAMLRTLVALDEKSDPKHWAT